MAKRLRILFIEDCEDDVLLLLRHLRDADYEVSHCRVKTAEALRAALEDGDWDLVLCDHNLPGYSPHAALKEIARSGNDLPFIVISGAVGEDALVELMKAGAGNIILKDNLTRLVPAIERELTDSSVRRAQRCNETALGAALGDSEAMLQGFMDHVPAEVAIKDAQGRYLLVNRETARRYDLDPEQVKGKVVHDFFANAVAEQFAAAERKVVETGEAVFGEETAVGIDGERTNLVIRFPVRDKVDEVTRIGVIATDITDRERAKESLRLFNRAIEASSNGILITDACQDDHPIIYCNPAFARITGYGSSEIIGRNCRFLQGDDRDQPERDLLGEAIGRHHFARVVLRNYRKNGELFWNEISVAPVRNADGEVTHHIGIVNDITEKKRAEEALRQGELRFSSLVSNISGAIYRGACDDDWTMAFMSEAIEEISGYPASDFVNNAVRSYASIIVAEDRQFVDETVRAAVGNKEPFTIRYRIRDSQDEVRWVWERGVGVFDDDGRLVCLDGTIFDITDQQNAEAALRESKERLTRAQRQAKIAYMRWTLDGQRLLYASDEYYRIFGVTRSEAPRSQAEFNLMIHPEDRQRAKDCFREVFTAPQDYEIEFRIVRPNGEIRHVMEIGEISYDGSGRAVAHNGTIQDITTVKRAEVAKRTMERLLTGILDNLLEAVVSVDEQGRIVLFNKGAEAVFGYRAEEAIGRPFDMLVPERFRTDHEALLAGGPVDGDGDHYRRRQITGLRRDGTEFPAETSLSTMTLEGKTIQTAMLHDVTDRMAAAEQLHQAQKMEAVGELTGGMAHDFNNVLAAIIGNLELLARSAKGDERQSRRVATAMSAAQRGASLTKRMLAFARRQNLEPAVIDCGETVRGFSDLLQQSLGNAMDLEIELADDLWPVEVDRAQLENTLLNLAINARDAMPEGGKLTIRARNVTLGGKAAAGSPAEFVALSFTDSGQGIPPEIIDRVLEPFFTTKEAGQGTGLGLSMIYGFVEQSGGKVEIESEVGRGTMVRLYLPRAGGEVEVEAPADGTTEYPTGSETILVVEDEPAVRDTVAEFLRELGYQVLEADQGRAALSVLDGDAEIDLLFTDVVMPGGMDGLGLARAMRRRRPDLKVLYTSGNLNERLIKDEAPDAVSDFLRKPYMNADLAKRVRAILDGIAA